MSDVLTALDATFLDLEQLDDGALMSIGGVMVFDPLPDGGVPSLGEIKTVLAARLRSLPRYTQRLSAPRVGGLAWPHWVADERFDLRNHVRHVALPAPGRLEQLCDFTADLFSHPLDRKRPLWELVLVEGLEDGRWALAQKTHHCLVDGVGSVEIVKLLLDSEPDGPGGTPDHISPTGSPPTRPHGLPRLPGLHSAEDLFQRSRSLTELIVREELIGAPSSSLNIPIGQTRRFTVVQVPLNDLKTVCHTLGASINDVVLTVCAEGLRRLLLARDEPLPSRGLRAMVPVNLRDQSGRLSLGNRVSSVFVDLPVAVEDPVSRLRNIVSSTRRLKRSGAAVGASTLIDLAELAPPVVLNAALARTSFSRRLFNLTITNVPGPQQQLYAFGAPLREIHPVVPLAPDHAVGIAVFSYHGLLTFGINVDAESTPDIAVLADGIGAGIETLVDLVSAHERSVVT